MFRCCPRFPQNGSVHGQPMWKCYTKYVSAVHMLLTFIPASYDDLLLLSEKEEEAEGASGGEEKKVRACVRACIHVRCNM